MSGVQPWELPPSWTWTTTGEVAEVVGGGTPRTENSSYFGGDIPWITPADLSGYREKYIENGARSISTEGLVKSGARIVPAGSVLLSTRAPIGYVAIARNALTTNQGFKTFVVPPGISADFVYHYLRYAKPLLDQLASGTTFRELSGKNAALVPLPLPPREEQARIASVIEQLEQFLVRGIDDLLQQRAKLAAYRAAVLRAACEGRLVPTEAELARAEGRAARTDSTRLPPGWSETTVESSIRIIDYRGRTPPYSENGVPHLRSQNVRQGKIIWDDLAFVSAETFNNYMTRGLPHKGDLLFTTEAPLGELAAVPDVPFSLAQRLMILQPDRSVFRPAFLMYQMMSDRFQAVLKGRSTGSTVTGVSSRNLRPAKLDVPPLQEQDRIVAEVERRLSVVERLEAAIDANLSRAKRLRQAILKRAFEGRLVPQDPRDERAGVLLERIRMERARGAGGILQKRRSRRGRKEAT